MKYLIVFSLCLLATLKVTIQSAFGKNKLKNTSDTMIFNSLFFGFTALLFVADAFMSPWQVWIYAFGAAVCAVIFQFTYSTALSIGSVSITVLIVNFNMVITTIISRYFFDEPISPVRLIGIIITVGAFFLTTDFSGRQTNVKKWLLLSIASLLSSSASFTIQKLFGKSEFNVKTRGFVSCTYISAAVLAFIVYLMLLKKGERKTLEINFRTVLFSAMIGFSLSLYQLLNTYAIITIDGTFLFPACSGGTIVFSVLSGIIIFKDRLTRKQYLSLCAGIVAIILMNF